MTAPSSSQIETLLNFLEEHRDLARGTLRNLEGRLEAQRLWRDICQTLNAMGGSNKTVQQWQRVWTDKKYLAKKNVAAARRSATTTGGGPPSAPPLSRWDTKVLNIMGDGFGEPQTTAAVPAFVVSESMPSASQLVTASPPQEIIEIDTEPATLHNTEPAMLHNTEQPSARLSRPRPVRRPRNPPADSVSNRFLRLEEERISQGEQWRQEYAGMREALIDIRQSLRELCTILREVLHHRLNYDGTLV